MELNFDIALDTVSSLSRLLYDRMPKESRIGFYSKEFEY